VLAVPGIWIRLRGGEEAAHGGGSRDR
jgi:hypothetical protein